ncbi:MAG TPA: type I restriction-modification system subunit M N-terminal domain-containing protein, partial [Hyphomonadaceae bacterium]|nr:type I restriction-modification system subunit M N-terminal domain-containing protein [Hyphomonadaceae bacterium]
MEQFQGKVGFIWSVADLLRGDYKPFEYADVILPFVVLRRLDCVLEQSKPAVRERYEFLAGRVDKLHEALTHEAGYKFYNTSRFDFARLQADPNNIAANLRDYVNGFSSNVQDILEKFAFREEVERLDSANLLYLIVQKFGEIDLHPDAVSNHEMGYIFEELIRRFSEQSNETAGEHFTPREVIRLMVNLLFSP